MKVRIEAQRALDGAVRCELVITGAHDAEVHLPAKFTAPGDGGVLELLADGAPFEIEVDVPLLQSVSVDTGRLVDVRGAGQGNAAGAYVMSTRERTDEPTGESGFVEDFTSSKGADHA